MDDRIRKSTEQAERRLTELEFRPSRRTVVSKAAWRWGGFLFLHVAAAILVSVLLSPNGVRPGGEIVLLLVAGLMLFAAWASPGYFPRTVVAEDGLLRLPYPQRLPSGKKRRAVPLSNLRGVAVEEKDGLRFRFLLADRSQIAIYEDALKPDEVAFLRELHDRLG